MNTYNLFSTTGKSTRFDGVRIARVESTILSTTRGELWFELQAFELEQHEWVISIGSRYSGNDEEQIHDFYRTPECVAVKDFLFDFEPSGILPDDLVQSNCDNILPLHAAADRAYYDAASKIMREIELHRSRSTATSPQATKSLKDATEPVGHNQHGELGLASRIKNWLHL